MSCAPGYSYRPIFEPSPNNFPSAGDCSAVFYNEHRSRLYEGGTYFRSKLQGPQWNEIQLSITEELVRTDEIVDPGLPPEIPPSSYTAYVYEMTLTVTYPGHPTETYVVEQTMADVPDPPDPIDPIPTEVPVNCLASEDIIGELRLLVNANVNSVIEMYPRGEDIFDGGGEDDPCLQAFPPTFMSGGEGGPTNPTTLASVRTGPQRSIIIIQTSEDIDGGPIAPPPSRRVQQWNGTGWISYCNLIPGECPGEGTC